MDHTRGTPAATNPQHRHDPVRTAQLRESGGRLDFAVHTLTVDGDRVVLQAIGDIDAETAPAFEACLHTHLHPGGVPEVVADLREVTFLGAAGVRALARAHQVATAAGQILLVKLSSTHRGPSRALHLTGLIETLQVSHD